MSNGYLTNLEAKNVVLVARKRIKKLYEEAKEFRGPERTKIIYKLLSEVRRISNTWRNERGKSKERIKKHLNRQADRNYKVLRPPEFMLLRSAIRDRRVSSSWAKVAALARKHRIPPAETGEWIAQCGGIDTIIRQGVDAKE